MTYWELEIKAIIFILPVFRFCFSFAEGEEDAQRSSTEQSGEAQGETAKSES